MAAESDIFLDHGSLEVAEQCVCCWLMWSSTEASELHRVHSLQQRRHINYSDLHDVFPQHHNCSCS